MTEKLFYQDSSIKEFTATVESCMQGKDGMFEVILDQTAFFPEGGGQYAGKAITLDSGLPRVQAHGFYEHYGFEKSCYGFELAL